ncbi:hypothetical protein VPH35_092514 [Triticum aestivum]
MPPKKLPKSKMGFYNMQMKPSGHFGVEFSDDSRRFCLGTYPTVHEGIRMEEIPKKKVKKRPTIVVGPGDSDEAEMARLARRIWTIPVESSEEDLGDSKEEDEGCNDPDKDEFWEQSKSSNE